MIDEDQRHDVAIVGSGPNGLAAAVTLAQAGKRVVIHEAAAEPGGGCRSAELTAPGFVHDVCAAVFPLAAVSRFFRDLNDATIEWIQPDILCAHPFDDGSSVCLMRSLIDTAENVHSDGAAYLRLMTPFTDGGEDFMDELLSPLHLPRHRRLYARFAGLSARSARGLADARFRGERARALFAGVAAHSILRLEDAFSSAAGLVLLLAAHLAGWPVPRGGAGVITRALVRRVKELGGELLVNSRIDDIRQLEGSASTMFDVMPRDLARIAGVWLPASYRWRLNRYRHGPGAFKLDWALSDPIPWRSSECQRAGTVHVGGTLDDIASSEASVFAGRHPERPFVIVAQPSLFDQTRRPPGTHIGWAYCHVPNGSTVDVTEPIESQIERFAPGFRDCILARSIRNTADLERDNQNDIGGDIGGGLYDWRQLLGRPTLSLHPYRTPNRTIYLCSAATPPGGGVHGLGGYYAALDLLRR